MAIVTISRVLGSGGDDIALKAAEDLGYDLVDTTLIVKVAERAGVSVEDAAYFDEKYQSRVVSWLKNFIEPRMGKILSEEGRHLNPEMFIEYCRTVILGLAETGSVIIVGRGGQFILKEEDTAFHVRIVADERYRIESIGDRHGISDKEALDMIRKSDSMRRNYIERFFGADWNDPMSYHLVIDSSKLGITMASSLIVHAVEQFSKNRDFIPGVRDRRKPSDRRSDKRRRGDRRESEVGFSPKEITHQAIRDGRPVRTHTKPDRRKRDRRKTVRRTSSHKTPEH